MSNVPFTHTNLRYKLLQPIGEGTFGKVYKSIKDTEYFALKKISSGLHITTIREIKILRSLSHKNIIQLIEINVDNSDIFLVFPFYRFDLYSYLKRNIPNRREIIHICKQIAEGIKYLHSKNVIHRDIKTSNILLDINLNIKIADFGMSTHFNKSMSPNVVTLWYRAPEILLNLSYSFEIDIWGFGCILGELMTTLPVFNGSTEIKLLDSIISICGSINNRTWKGIEENEKFKMFRLPQSQRNLLNIYKNCDKDIIDLLDKILLVDPSQRITIDDIINSKIFENYDSEIFNRIAEKYKFVYYE